MPRVALNVPIRTKRYSPLDLCQGERATGREGPKGSEHQQADLGDGGGNLMEGGILWLS